MSFWLARGFFVANSRTSRARIFRVVTLRIKDLGFGFGLDGFAGADVERGSDAIGCATSIVGSLSVMPRRVADAPSLTTYI